MNVILLYSDYRHVSATQLAIFRVVSARIQIYLYCFGIIPQLTVKCAVILTHYKYSCILALTALKIAT